MDYTFYIILGLIPSFIWLLFFLRKDSHPESNKMIIKVFLLGMVAAYFAAYIEHILVSSLKNITDIWLYSFPVIYTILYHFLAIAFVEEYVKYLAVRLQALRSSEFDEPTDAMLYVIIAGLGFAALENILVLFMPFDKALLDTLTIAGFRFIGATFLHALCSAVVGYFLALSLYETKKRFLLITLGLIIASFLHGIYNFSIMKIIDNTNFIFVPIFLLISVAVFVSFGFKKLKNMASVCKTK
ncbi:MAG: PrsW family intramembrane metalloprotease [Candidatus Pacebacteria bacterium]|nr:PrsW family intramembrane metalloprotease [Candidatus Paceibacterota bacterium]